MFVFLPVFSSAVEEPTVVVDTPDFGALPKKKNLALKGKYHANLLSFQNPKMLACQQKKKETIVKFVINYHPRAIKLLISASGRRQSRPVWIES